MREAVMKLQGKKIGILIESDYYEKEIFYYGYRFAEEGAELHFLTCLWGQPSLTFTGHEYKVPFECHESFEDMDDVTLRSFSAIIVPSAFVADRLRYTENINKLPPATEFLKRAFAEKSILKGIICHGMWLVAPAPELVRGRRVVAHNNLLGDVRNMGAIYTDQDVVVDGDLVTARTGGHCHLFARTIIDMLETGWALNTDNSREQALAVSVGREIMTALTFSHVAIACKDPLTTERFYTKYFGFKRARVIPLGTEQQIVFIKLGNIYLELFQAKEQAPIPPAGQDGPWYPGWRHIAFQVENVDAKLAAMGDDAKITLGPLDFDAFIPGWRTVWVADPDGNIVEISQGYVDQENPPQPSS